MAAYEKAPPIAVGQDQNRDKEHDEILSQNEKSVNGVDWLRDFRARNGLTGREIIETIHFLFPGFDKTLLSKCMNPEKYGIQLSPAAMHLLERTLDSMEKGEEK